MAWTSDIKGALTIPVLVQYVQVYQRLQVVQLTPTVEDTLHWHLSADASTHPALLMLPCGSSQNQGALENKSFQTKAPNNCRFSIWLALLGRCWTAKRRQNHLLV
jgi:hypothetical protein